jgi:hypothetical protein
MSEHAFSLTMERCSRCGLTRLDIENHPELICTPETEEQLKVRLRRLLAAEQARIEAEKSSKDKGVPQ